MREIKFRGKLLKEQQSVNDPLNNWFYGDLVHELSTGKTFILDVSHTNKGKAPFKELGVEVIPETIGQFTGLKDKNGVDIYEGDVLKIFNIIGVAMFQGYVVYNENDGCFELRMEDDEEVLSYPRNRLEVIGNIHEGKK